MKKTNLIFLFIFISLCISCINGQKKLFKYVNTFVGTGGHGHTFPGSTAPFGMMQLSPDTRLETWDGCSGYHYSDSTIYGFTHTHLSGTGILDYGDFLFLPIGQNKSNQSIFTKQPTYQFYHKDELATPGYYSVLLFEDNIKCELTTTSRCGIHQYTFPKDTERKIYFDLKHRDLVHESFFQIISNTEIAGYRKSESWAKDQRLYFVAEFSEPFTSKDIALDNAIVNKDSLSGKNIKALFHFSKGNNPILIRIGISSISIDGARKNLKKEITHWDFNTTHQQAQATWQKTLSKIQVEGDEEKKKKFYTSLYHCFVAPNLFMDVDNMYLGRDMQPHKAIGYDHYTVFSLWDTYRTLHPLMTIIDQKTTNDFIQTFISQFEQGGKLPVWELSANETNCMIGYHSIPVIVDAFLKGIKNYDYNKVFTAMTNSAMQDEFGIDAYKKQRFIAADDEPESVSRTLEYAYDDWCIAQMAKAMGKDSIYKEFIQRSQAWKNVFDPKHKFMCARLNGSWQWPFNPTEVNFNFTEANSWQYSFYVPQDIESLINYYGGNIAFEQKLDSLFNTKEEISGRRQDDISGLIGQYAHGNEPSHHMAFLYNYVGKPHKTQKIIAHIRNTMYHNKPDGLIGNEDCGQMSAWYVMSSMGLYPVCPGSNNYQITTPDFKKISINLENGKIFTIKSINLNDVNIYIQKIELNGRPYTKSYLSHQTIMDGGELKIYLTNNPINEWGTKTEDIERSIITDFPITPAPYAEETKRSFIDSLKISFSSAELNNKIYFSTTGETNPLKMSLYENPFYINNSTTFSIVGVNKKNQASLPIQTTYNKIDPDRTICIKTPYSPLYSAGGNNALIDMIEGKADFRTGTWQGYNEIDLEATVDLGKIKTISEVGINFIQDIDSWIFMPEYVEFAISTDGKNFITLEKANNQVSEKQLGGTLQYFKTNFNSTQVRYIKVFAKNRKTIPQWHIASGNKTWIFADEIIIK